MAKMTAKPNPNQVPSKWIKVWKNGGWCIRKENDANHVAWTSNTDTATKACNMLNDGWPVAEVRAELKL